MLASGPSPWLGFTISAVALGLALLSLYFARFNWRRLKMVGNPPTYGVAGNLLRLAITISNPGSRVGVVPGLRIRFPDELGGSYAWSNSRCETTEPDTPSKFFQPVPIASGASEVLVIEFHLDKRVDQLITEQGVYGLEVSMVRPRHRQDEGDKPEWRDLGTLWLYVGPIELSGFGAPNGHWNGLR
jgi:hypothetical protein